MIWEKFKKKVKKGRGLNDVLILLIYKFVNQDKYDLGELNGLLVL